MPFFNYPLKRIISYFVRKIIRNCENLKEIFDEIQMRLNMRNGIPPRSGTTTNLLLGLMQCGMCHSRLKPARGKQHRIMLVKAARKVVSLRILAQRI